MLEALARVGAGGRYIEGEIAQALAARSGEDPLDQLSLREVEILRLLRQGQDLAGIAAAIGISYEIVANTCVRIKAKLGVARTADLLRVAAQLDAVERS